MSDSTLVDHENQAQADALHKLVCYRQSHQKSGDRTVSFLLALVKYAPTRDQIAQDVINCDHRSLKVLFEKFRNGVILPSEGYMSSGSLALIILSFSLVRIFTTKPIDFMLEKESCTAMSRVRMFMEFWSPLLNPPSRFCCATISGVQCPTMLTRTRYAKNSPWRS